MSKRKSSKLTIFLGGTIHDMKFFITGCLWKTTNEVVLHVSIDNTRTNVQDMLMIVTLFYKYISSVKNIIFAPVLHVNAVNADRTNVSNC